MRITVLALALAALPAFAQDGPRVIDVDGGGTTFFPADLDEQLARDDVTGEPLILDVAADADRVQPLAALMAPLSQIAEGGATRIEMLDRCAGFESSLVTLLTGTDIQPAMAQRHRERFEEFTQIVLAEREAAGLSAEAARVEARDAILAAGRLYMEEWENARTRTGSYFSAPLRRVDQLACAALLDGGDVTDRGSLNAQLGLEDPLDFGLQE